MRVEVSTIDWTIWVLTSKFASGTSKVSLKVLVGRLHSAREAWR
jgi:hypothetical protein